MRIVPLGEKVEEISLRTAIFKCKFNENNKTFNPSLGEIMLPIQKWIAAVDFVSRGQEFRTVEFVSFEEETASIMNVESEKCSLFSLSLYIYGKKDGTNSGESCPYPDEA